MSTADSHCLDYYGEEEKFILDGPVLDQTYDPDVGPILKPGSTFNSKTLLWGDKTCASTADFHCLDYYGEEEKFILNGPMLDQPYDSNVGPILKPESTFKSKTLLLY